MIRWQITTMNPYIPNQNSKRLHITKILEVIFVPCSISINRFLQYMKTCYSEVIVKAVNYDWSKTRKNKG